MRYVRPEDNSKGASVLFTNGLLDDVKKSELEAIEDLARPGP